MHKFYFLLSILLFTSCQTTPKEANSNTQDSTSVQIHKEYTIDGKLHSTLEVRDGKVNGWATTFYPDGQVMTKCQYKNGIPLGKETMYYESGKVYRIMPFNENGKKEGWVTKYYRNGKLKSRQYYYQGMPSNQLEEFHTDGNKITKYPHLTHRIVYNRDYEKQKLLLFEMSNHSKKTTFYEGRLVDEKYFDIYEMPCTAQKGVGEILLNLDFKGKVIISARVPTPHRNSQVFQTIVEIE